MFTDAHWITEEYNSYFDRIWENTCNLSSMVLYEEWQEKGVKPMVKKAIYRFPERWVGTFQNAERRTQNAERRKILHYQFIMSNLFWDFPGFLFSRFCFPVYFS